MPIDDKPTVFDVECDACGNRGMKKTQAPRPGGITTVFKCPECGGTKTNDDVDYAYFVDKR